MVVSTGANAYGHRTLNHSHLWVHQDLPTLSMHMAHAHTARAYIGTYLGSHAEKPASSLHTGLALPCPKACRPRAMLRLRRRGSGRMHRACCMAPLASMHRARGACRRFVQGQSAFAITQNSQFELLSYRYLPQNRPRGGLGARTRGRSMGRSMSPQRADGGGGHNVQLRRTQKIRAYVICTYLRLNQCAGLQFRHSGQLRASPDQQAACALLQRVTVDQECALAGADEVEHMAAHVPGARRDLRR